jgi:hypothetical protein
VPSNSTARFWSEQSEQDQIFDRSKIIATRLLFSLTGRLEQAKRFYSYAVTDDGTVFTCRICAHKRKERIREMAKSKTNFGYIYVRLHTGQRPAMGHVHRLVAEQYLPPPLPGQKVLRHLNGDPGDNRVENLMWGTQADNMQDCIRHGRTLRGLKNPNAKLNYELAKAIRILVKEGYSTSALAHFIGVSTTAIQLAVNGEQWSEV